MNVVREEHDLTLVVSDRLVVADDVILLDLRDPAGEDLPPWQPGAHIDLRFDPELVRQFSLCGDPSDHGTWRLGILLERNSRGGSAAAHALRVGDTIEARGPRNNFELEPADDYLFIAGGIGITPIAAMIGQVAATGRNWRLAYGGRTRTSMAFRGQLEELGADRVEILPQDEVGMLDLAALLGDVTAETRVYCCGPTGLLDAIDERCTGWPAGRLHIERFTPREVGEPVRSDSFEVELSRSGLLLTVPPDRSILDVIIDSGVDAPSSCTEGTCGTCETVVLDGLPDHRDSLLSTAEQEANETMMICVSRAISQRLVLDI